MLALIARPNPDSCSDKGVQNREGGRDVLLDVIVVVEGRLQYLSNVAENGNDEKGNDGVAQASLKSSVKLIRRRKVKFD